MGMKTFRMYADGIHMKTGEVFEKMYIGSFEIDEDKPIETEDPQCFLKMVSDCIDSSQDSYGYIDGTEIKPGNYFWSPRPVVDSSAEMLVDRGRKRIKDFEWDAQSFDKAN
ncbi:hypothetical protein EP56_01680 [Listeriaceae bacterium FSL A5-0209]|nr:hypothetical protein EP56_01680 [Listeriaceae bacterium FSL A5-0209]